MAHHREKAATLEESVLGSPERAADALDLAGSIAVGRRGCIGGWLRIGRHRAPHTKDGSFY